MLILKIKKMKKNNKKIDESGEIRISKYLAYCGLDSRRKCEALVTSGKIKVNGIIIEDLSFKVGPDDMVEYEGKRLAHIKNITLALNKPPGYLSTVKDGYRRDTVIDLIKDINERLYPVGRLDYMSRGLIILTNDGELSFRITHPSFQVPKTYVVKINRIMEKNDFSSLKNGIKIEGKMLIPLDLELLLDEGNSSLIRIKIIEGRKRIIREVFKKLGYKVLDLKRTSIGKLTVEGIDEGKYRILTQKEIEELCDID